MNAAVKEAHVHHSQPHCKLERQVQVLDSPHHDLHRAIPDVKHQNTSPSFTPSHFHLSIHLPAHSALNLTKQTCVSAFIILEYAIRMPFPFPPVSTAHLPMEGTIVSPHLETPGAFNLMGHLQGISQCLAATTIAKVWDYASWNSIRRHIILSLAFQHARICATMTPKEAHDRILTRLQQEYYPLRQRPTWCRLAIQALIVVRYVWLAAKMLFLELYLLDLAFWKMHRYARQRNLLPHMTRIFSPGFHRLAVLAPLPPSRFRYVLANTVASIWYSWAYFFSIPLIAWMLLAAFKA